MYMGNLCCTMHYHYIAIFYSTKVKLKFTLEQTTEVSSLYKYITFFNAHGHGTHKLHFRYVVEIKDEVQCWVQTLELLSLLHKNQTLANHYD